MNQQQVGRARELHEENLALRRARGDERGAVEPMSGLAGIALLSGDYPGARVLVEETLAVLAGARATLVDLTERDPSLP